jgi:putative membrane protein
MKALGAVWFLAVPLLGAAQLHLDAGARQMLASRDIAFALEAQQSDVAGIELGRLAAEKGASPELKQFGTQLADECARRNRRLAEFAAGDKMVLPQVATAKDQSTYDKLRKLSGAAFDKAYTKQMLKTQKKVAKRFARQAKKGKNDQLRELASESLPALEQHIDQLKSIRIQTS